MLLAKLMNAPFVLVQTERTFVEIKIGILLRGRIMPSFNWPLWLIGSIVTGLLPAFFSPCGYRPASFRPQTISTLGGRL
ncbi:hypothetical protein AXF42_Ash012365 [Apostasia shenzhenica]|uniref:Uncharacterized protein n=1 Tax=Apostasia shenzhenica TaxID=1088818 RepID=A0A2I0AD15_9ASPA|nr:hypothetical protein AXF42_Ash012365 [Apostasia shenzhenica]